MDRKASDVPLEQSDTGNGSGDPEAPQAKKLKYPFSVFFIIVNEFCERFSYYGMRTVLTLYLTNILRFDESTATVLYHTFICLCYFTPVVGAILADNYLGKFKTIFFLSILYACGSILLSVAAIPNTIPQVAFSLIGLAMIAFGTGGIKPCVSAFGGQQFTLPEQQKQLEQFFSVFYFSINAGSLISTFLTPLLRENVKCFGDDSCFSLAFGIPAILMVVSIGIFISGKRMYKIKPPESSIMGAFVMCIGRAIKRKITSKGEKHNHWLEYASDKYDMHLINDIKRVLAVAFVFIPLPAFWALYDQQGSRWTFQANRMSGAIGSTSIKPDQMQIVNPVLILLLVPLFESFIYPAIQKCFNFTPLRRISAGMIFCGLSFIVSAVLELQLKSTYEITAPVGKTQLNFINVLPCQIKMTYNDPQPVSIDSERNRILYELEQIANYTIEAPSQCGDYHFEEGDETQTVKLGGNSTEGYSVVITIRDAKIVVAQTLLTAPFIKSESTKPRVGFILDDLVGRLEDPITLTVKGEDEATFIFPNSTDNNSTSPSVEHLFVSTTIKELEYGTYDVFFPESINKTQKMKIDQGGCYLGVVLEDKNGDVDPKLILVETTHPNSISIFWQIPQYFVVTVGEVMFSVTGLQFSFTEAPGTMRSIMQAMWCLIVAFGNVIVIIVEASNTGLEQYLEFFLFAGIMFAATLVFMLLALTYEYTEKNEDEEKKEGKTDDNLQEVGLSEEMVKKDSMDDSSSPANLLSTVSEPTNPVEDQEVVELEMNTERYPLTATNLLSTSAEPQVIEESHLEQGLDTSSTKPTDVGVPEEKISSEALSDSRSNSLVAAVDSAVAALDESLEQTLIEHPQSPRNSLSSPDETTGVEMEANSKQEVTTEASIEQTAAEPPSSPDNSLPIAEESIVAVMENAVHQLATEEVALNVSEEQTPAEPYPNPEPAAEEPIVAATEDDQSATEEVTLKVPEEQTLETAAPAAEEPIVAATEDNQSATEEVTLKVPEEQTPAEPSPNPETAAPATEEPIVVATEDDPSPNAETAAPAAEEPSAVSTDSTDDQIVTEQTTPESVSADSTPAELTSSPENSLPATEETIAVAVESNPSAAEEITPEVPVEQPPAERCPTPENSLPTTEETTAVATEDRPLDTEEVTSEVSAEQAPAEPSPTPATTLSTAEDTTAAVTEDKPLATEEVTSEASVE